MIRDLASEFSTEQTLVLTVADDPLSTNVVDTQATGGDVAVGSSLEVAFTFDAALEADDASVTLTINLLTSDTISSGDVATPSTVWTSGALKAKSGETGYVAGKGYTVKAKLPYGCKRYLQAEYEVAGTAGKKITAGKVTGGIVKATTHWKAANPVGVSY